MIVYGDLQSGNCLKIKLLLSFLEIEHEWKHVNILEKETQTDDSIPSPHRFAYLPISGRNSNTANPIFIRVENSDNYFPLCVSEI